MKKTIDAREALLNLIDNYYNMPDEGPQVDGDPVIFVPYWFPEHCLTDADRDEGHNVILERNGMVPFEFYVRDRDQDDVVSLSFPDSEGGDIHFRVEVHRPSVLAMKASIEEVPDNVNKKD